MTPSEAVALLERHRELWPVWIIEVRPSVTCVLVRGNQWQGWMEVALERDRFGSGRAHRCKVRKGLPDAENVRRIIAAAEKGYRRQRLRQVEKQRQGKPMKRTELKRGKGPERKTRLKPVRRDRKAKRFEEDFGGKDCAEWGSMRPCDACARTATQGMPNHNHHVGSRNSRSAKAADQVTLCSSCHTRLHAHGSETFEAVSGVSLRELAKKRYREWLDQGGHELPSGLDRHGETR